MRRKKPGDKRGDIMGAVAIENPIAEIYDRWVEAVEPVVGENKYSVGVSATINDAPYARIFVSGLYTTHTDLVGNEVCQQIEIQSESYTTGMNAMSEAYALDMVQRNAMIGMGFRCVYGPVLMDNVDSRLRRLVTRYTRQYTGQLPAKEGE